MNDHEKRYPFPHTGLDSIDPFCHCPLVDGPHIHTSFAEFAKLVQANPDKIGGTPMAEVQRGSRPPIQEGTPTPAPKETINQEADRIIHTDRNQAYGHPLDDYQATAKIFTGILQGILKPGVEVTWDLAMLCMIGVKLSRESRIHKRDNLVDAAGYAGCVEMAYDEKERREEVAWKVSEPRRNPSFSDDPDSGGRPCD